MTELRMKIGRTLLENLERLIALEMLGHTPAGAARILNVNRDTIYEWKKNPLYVAMKTRERNEFMIATTDVIIGATLDAVRHLQDVVTDFRIPKVDRVPAALALHELGNKLAGPMSTHLALNDPSSHDAGAAKHIFPKVVDDRKSKELALTAPARRPDEVLAPLPAREQNLHELLDQLHEQPNKAGQ
jgi:hypothetical protein